MTPPSSPQVGRGRGRNNGPLTPASLGTVSGKESKGQTCDSEALDLADTRIIISRETCHFLQSLPPVLGQERPLRSSSPTPSCTAEETEAEVEGPAPGHTWWQRRGSGRGSLLLNQCSLCHTCCPSTSGHVDWTAERPR